MFIQSLLHPIPYQPKLICLQRQCYICMQLCNLNPFLSVPSKSNECFPTSMEQPNNIFIELESHQTIILKPLYSFTNMHIFCLDLPPNDMLFFSNLKQVQLRCGNSLDKRNPGSISIKNFNQLYYSQGNTVNIISGAGPAYFQT